MSTTQLSTDDPISLIRTLCDELVAWRTAHIEILKVFGSGKPFDNSHLIGLFAEALAKMDSTDAALAALKAG